MSSDRKCARSTRREIPISQKDVVILGTPKESVEARAIRSAVLRVASSLVSMASQEHLRYQRLLEAHRADTSSTPKRIRRCPVSGKPIPPLEKIEKVIEESLTLSNWCWPKSVAVKGIALALSKWAEEVGLEKAARRGKLLFEKQLPLQYADQANLPWLNRSLIEQLTPEKFADRMGELADELERRSDGSADDRSAEHVLQDHGSPHPVDRTGDGSSGERKGS